jgi:HAD superfamily hydrolase (TIGR01490 family)
VFDLDGTLLRGDSFLPFLVRYGWRKRRWLGLALLGGDLLLLACRVLSARSAKERTLRRLLGGDGVTELEQFTGDFCRGWVSRSLHPLGVARLREHQEQGHRVVLLSASPDVYVRAVGKHLGIEEVVCTQVVVRDGRCTGEIQGENCKGEAKLGLLRRHLGVETAPAESFAYGDSKSDLPVLRWARHGFWVTRRGVRPVDPDRAATEPGRDGQ